jgi:hypothetical protein
MISAGDAPHPLPVILDFEIDWTAGTWTITGLEFTRANVDGTGTYAPLWTSDPTGNWNATGGGSGIPVSVVSVTPTTIVLDIGDATCVPGEYCVGFYAGPT